jgi:hypothetical protein
VRDGYSAVRRALAGLLGVHLVTPEKVGPIPPSTSGSPYFFDRISAAEVIAEADPVARLMVRQSPLVTVVLQADLLVNAIDIADRLTAREGKFATSNVARAVAHDLARDLGRARDLNLDLNLDLDLIHSRALSLVDNIDLVLERANFGLDLDLDLAPALTRARALDLALDLAPALTRARALDLALDLAAGLVRTLDLRDGSLPSGFERGRGIFRALDLARDSNLTHVRARDLVRGRVSSRARARARNVTRAGASAEALAIARWAASGSATELSEALGIEHPDGLAAALLDGALDDFTQADLSAVDLAHIDLAGVRWSVSGTRWPRGLDVEELIQQSEETEPGSDIYVIASPGQSERTGAEARV